MKQIKTIVQQFSSLEGTLFRYSLSYGALMAVFPSLFILILLVEHSILNLVDLLRLLYLFLPEELIGPFVEFLLSRSRSLSFSSLFSLGITIWVASQSFYSFLLMSAAQEGIKTKKLLLRLKAVLLFLFFVGSLMTAGWVSLFFFLNPIFFLAAAFSVVLDLFYRSLTFYRRSITYGWPGAVFSTAAILLVGSFFFWAIQSFTSYDSVYGPLASVVVLFVSIYLLSSLLYFGYCINLILQPVKLGMKRKQQKGERLFNLLQELFIDRSLKSKKSQSS